MMTMMMMKNCHVFPHESRNRQRRAAPEPPHSLRAPVSPWAAELRPPPGNAVPRGHGVVRLGPPHVLGRLSLRGTRWGAGADHGQAACPGFGGAAHFRRATRCDATVVVVVVVVVAVVAVVIIGRGLHFCTALCCRRLLRPFPAPQLPLRCAPKRKRKRKRRRRRRRKRRRRRRVWSEQHLHRRRRRPPEPLRGFGARRGVGAQERRRGGGHRNARSTVRLYGVGYGPKNLQIVV
jgi:hypothetical protein